VVERSGPESADELSVRMQRLIANSLNVSATSFTSADKMDLIKRRLHAHSTLPGRFGFFLPMLVFYISIGILLLFCVG